MLSWSLGADVRAPVPGRMSLPADSIPTVKSVAALRPGDRVMTCDGNFWTIAATEQYGDRTNLSFTHRSGLDVSTLARVIIGPAE